MQQRAGKGSASSDVERTGKGDAGAEASRPPASLWACRLEESCASHILLCFCRSTMEIIDQLEQGPRGVYSGEQQAGSAQLVAAARGRSHCASGTARCHATQPQRLCHSPSAGSLGFISFNDTFDLNIVIRTAVLHGDKLTIGAGGAIVVQSGAWGRDWGSRGVSGEQAAGLRVSPQLRAHQADTFPPMPLPFCRFPQTRRASTRRCGSRHGRCCVRLASATVASVRGRRQ